MSQLLRVGQWLIVVFPVLLITTVVGDTPTAEQFVAGFLLSLCGVGCCLALHGGEPPTADAPADEPPKGSCRACRVRKS